MSVCNHLEHTERFQFTFERVRSSKQHSFSLKKKRSNASS